MADEDEFDDFDEPELNIEVDESEEELEEDEFIERERDIDDHPHEIVSSKNITVIVVPDIERKTQDFMSLMEFTAVLGIRAQQIDNGDTYFTQIENLTDAISIAKKELLEGSCPLIIERVISDKKPSWYSGTGIVFSVVEHWRVSELTLPQTVETLY